MDQKSFLSQYNFNASLTGAIGIESEYFLTNGSKMPIGKSPAFLKLINDETWTYELSACQVEHRSTPDRATSDILKQIALGRLRGAAVAEQIGTRLKVLELAPQDMPLDVYPHDERYSGIVASISKEELIAACRVAGTHFHIGVRNIEEAIVLHNALAENLDKFIDMGDHTNGERIQLYKIMAKNWQPPRYESVDHLQAVAKEQGFEDKLRNCWHLIRISFHGTVEMRMFGISDSVEEVAPWIEAVREVERKC